MHATDQVTIIFNVDPVPQLRPRASAQGGRVRVYDLPKVKNYKTYLHKLAAKTHRTPLLGPLEVDLVFYRRVQKSLSKTERERRLNNESKPTMKPDVDNYVKSALDAFNGVLWHDDAQVVKLIAEKHYSDRNYLRITVKPL